VWLGSARPRTGPKAGFHGTITAVDQSPALIDAGRRIAQEDGLGDRIAFQMGDAHRLDFEAASFDVVIAHTLVSHVADPLQVVREAARVACPGGSVAVFDGDYGSWTFGCSDPALGDAMEAGIVAAAVAQPRVMRDMPRLLHVVGLRMDDVLAFVYADVGNGRFFLGAAEAYAPIVAGAGLVPRVNADAWVSEQREAAAQGTFFSACNYYAYLARR
jgi:SAM-dependent methyltransferase